jgi:hypothetical protein
VIVLVADACAALVADVAAVAVVADVVVDAVVFDALIAASFAFCIVVIPVESGH